MTDPDQCIICLEPLVVPAAPSVLAAVIASPTTATTTTTSTTSSTELGAGLDEVAALVDPPTITSTTTNTTTERNYDIPSDFNPSSRVASLDGCNHVIHESCILLWAQKTNTCPICREPFRTLKVFDSLGGTLLESTEVEEKKQVAEFDPQEWLAENAEEADEPELPCPICNSSDREDVLLLCDGCDAAYHTYCMGLDHIPSGNWYCIECADTFESHASRDTHRPPRRPRQRRNGNQSPSRFFPRTRERMRRARRQARSLDWTGPWGQFSGRVYDALQIDLDNHEDDDALAEFRMSQLRREREQREYQRWQQRVSIANRLGAGDIFTNSLPRAARQQLQHQPPPPPVQETRDEVKSWGALERARLSEGSGSNQASRKRRLSTASPVDPSQEPERKLKRPRTRRLLPAQSESSSSKPSSSAQTGQTAENGAASRVPDLEEAPSFLSALLREVGASTTSDDETVRSHLGRGAADAASPASSPAPSAHNSPRALSLTPPPMTGRPSSPPLSLSSYVEPRYPRANYSPVRQNSRDHHSDSETHAEKSRDTPRALEIRQPRPRRPRPEHATRSVDTSPARGRLSPEAKASINVIVRTALKPHWHAKEMTTEEYANINRDVSRKLYDEIKDPSSLDEDDLQKWGKVASQEVAQALADSKA